MLKLEDQLCFALYTASNAVMRAYRPNLAQLHLTYPQYLIMIALWQHGSATVAEIASRLSIETDTIALLVDQLEASGYVHQARGTLDRHSPTIVLTQTGMQLEEAASEAQRQVACSTGLTDAGLAAMRQQLHGMIDQITASRDGSSGEPG